MADAQPSTLTPTSGPDLEDQPHYGWALFVGSILAFAVLKEAVHGLGTNPIAARAKGLSRSDAAFGMAVLMRFAARIGAASARPRPG
jgi:hypothetical protein